MYINDVHILIYVAIAIVGLFIGKLINWANYRMLENKKIITHKEAEAININKVYQFTKSKIWEEMIHAHVVRV